MKNSELFFISALAFATLLMAPSHPEYYSPVSFTMADQYTSGSTIAMTVTNNSSADVYVPEQGQCHRFVKIYDSSGAELTISDPDMACTMEFRSTKLAAGETKTIDSWNQKVYGTCPPCTTSPCPMMEGEAYPFWCEQNPHRVPDGRYSVTTTYITNSNLDTSDAVTISHSFTIGSSTTYSFSDVPPWYWAYEHIQYLYENGIANGYGNGLFRPDWNITRAEMVKMALEAADIPLNTYIQAPAPYKDVTPSHSLVYYVATAQSRGLIEDSDYFYPEQPASRFFTLQLLIDALGDTPDIILYQSQSPAFSDVNSGEERAYTNYAEEQGIVSGYGDGTYGPSNPVTRAEMSKIIHNTLEN